VKGSFAQQLADILDAEGVVLAVPSYLAEAIQWVTRENGAA
jgi:hypothetical protein